mmetsp:Transcript_47305/g.93069  ORF Transcript_47305/g.93069 Transcript_47305/m.93069 type:complete len:435 (+) Transcript_47305:1077-2381(+)
MRMRLSHFDPKGPLDEIKPDVVCSDYAKTLSQDGTTQSVALLKNSGILPLDASKVSSVAVIGPNSELSKSMTSYYGDVNVCDMKYYNMVDAVSAYVSNTTTQPGVPSVLSDDTSQIPKAVAAAKVADVVVLAIGTDLSAAREGQDATSISLSTGQLTLIQKVADAASQPVIVVQFTAVPLDISSLLNNPKIGAILHVGQPSVNTLGIGHIIFGKAVPAGRTIQTILPTSYADQVSIFDFNMRPGPSDYPRPDCSQPFDKCPKGTNPGRTHRFYTGKAVVPFGFGLSYTTFKYSPAALHGTNASLTPVRDMLAATAAANRSFASLEAVKQTLISYSVNVTNTGNYDADDAVLGFIVPPGAGKDGVPLQTLFGFDRVHVRKGETVTVWLYPSLLDFTVVNEAGKRTAHPGEYTVKFGVQSTHQHGQGFAEHKFTLV